jgi:hypothetical protein
MGSERTITRDESARAFVRLSTFKQLIVYAVAQNGGTPDAKPEMCPYGLAVKDQLEAWLDEDVNHGRLYPNIDELVDYGYVEKHELDKRTNGLRLTEAGVDAIVEYKRDVEAAALDALAHADRAIDGGSA